MEEDEDEAEPSQEWKEEEEEVRTEAISVWHLTMRYL